MYVNEFLDNSEDFGFIQLLSCDSILERNSKVVLVILTMAPQ